MTWLLDHGPAVHAAAFLAPLLLLALWEAARPRRMPTRSRRGRWPLNLGLAVLGALGARLVIPAGLAGIALWAERSDLGLLRVAHAPPWIAFVLAFLALDLAVFAQHVALHRWRPLWWIHRLHHTDRDLDATSAGRFHPLEIVGSLAWKGAVVVALGAPASAAVAYEITLALFSVLTHANVDVSPRAQRAASRVLVTPDLHRIHHSVRPEESLSNFGTITTAWDRLFGTLRADAVEDQRTMALGVEARSGDGAWGR